MALRRHPSGPHLGAWFDGEQTDETVGPHVARCSRCHRRLSEMARVRAWIRAQPFFAMGDEPAATAPLRRWRPLLTAAVVVLVALLLGPGAPRAARTGGEPGRRGSSPSDALLNLGAEGERRAPESPGTPAGEGSGGAGSGRAGPGGAGTPALRLGLVVPTTGPAAREGAEVREAVRRRVEQANAGGGVGGRPVELVVAAAEDQESVATLPEKVTALVGGFGSGTPADTAWLLPAEPGLTGANVVPAEPSPQAVGQQVGELLRRQRVTGRVGVVVGAGPESAMGAGLASKMPTTTVAAPAGTACTAEVASLRRSGAVALAVAGPPELAGRCLRVAARAGWRPRAGTVVPPSAAYAHLETLPEAAGARTLLGLPWPTSPAPGAARFRVSAGSRSYRALVSFAATELAIEVARRHGTVSVGALARGTWSSDLVEMAGGQNRSATVVVASGEGWLPAPWPAGGGAGPVTLPPPPLPAPPLPLPLPGP